VVARAEVGVEGERSVKVSRLIVTQEEEVLKT
jgi:hypothetical protein